MTEPELGSGALREALEKAMDALERIRASQRIVGVLVVQDMEGAIRSGRAALSLSSPIEHEPKGVQTLAKCICKDDAYAAREGWNKDCPVHGAPTPQASSEVRERLQQIVLEWDCDKFIDGPHGKQYEVHAGDCRRCEILAALAPSRQGAAKDSGG